MSVRPAPRDTKTEVALFGVLVSLALKAALDTVYGHSIPGVTSFVELRKALWVPASLLVVVFLITLVRFVFGVYRFYEETSQPSIKLKSGAQLWNIAAILVLFVFFYLTGLSIQHAESFFIALIVVHVWDLILFFSVFALIDGLTGTLKRVMWQFIGIDFFTILGLAICVRYQYRDKAVVLMLVLAAIDFYLNRSFFLRSSVRAEEKRNASEKKRIYFAAPLFTQAEWQWNLRLAKKLSETFEIILPQRRAEPMLNRVEPFDPNALFVSNKDGIENSHLVLAILDQADADSGTAWECGYAHKLGKPIIGIRTDLRGTADDPAGVNLMIARSCTELILLPLDKRDDMDWLAVEVATLVHQL